MRLTVLQQQTKALQAERPETGGDVSKRRVSVKHLLWHGNTEEALARIDDLLMESSLIQAPSAATKKVAENLSDFETYIRNNRECFTRSYPAHRCTLLLMCRRISFSIPKASRSRRIRLSAQTHLCH